MTILRTIRTKLASRRGFTFTELLITAAIALLVASAVSVGIATSAKAHTAVALSSEASALCGTIAVELADVLRFARNIDGTAAPVVFDSARFGSGVSIGSDAEGHITVGGHLILPAKTYTRNLKAAADLNYIADTGFSLGITVMNDEGETLETATIGVMPLP